MNSAAVMRRMEARDLDAIMSIELKSFPSPWSRRQFEEELARAESYFWVGEINGAVVGYAGFWHVADEAHIVSLAVDPSARRAGVGSALLGLLVGEALRMGLRSATLEVRAGSGDADSPAVRIYERAGFCAVAIRRNYYQNEGVDALVMMKELGK